ncbi:MAG: diguanylate cyclase, partial [Desulfobacterales bacterium]|nr:diguanylate cyclase [Desulfobacterales bacterium]
MKGTDFIGAFEFYRDITAQKISIDALIFQFKLLLYISTIIIINVVIIAFFIYRDSMKERKIFEHTILKMANTDELTGLYNRRGFEELLQWEFGKIERYQRKACILLFDLDHFKNVNDTYGHQAGDNVLVAVAQKCKSVLRKSDIFGRYGGEEFIAFLPDTNRLNALKVAEKLRRIIETAPISTKDGTINITISIGVAYFGDKHVLSINRVIKYADDSLYIAKRNGRNQIFCAQVNAYIERGKAYDRKGQHDKAISEFNKAIEISPKYASAYTNRGLAYGNKGQYDRAISDYNTAIEINPRLAEAYTNRGIAYGSKGQYEKEISDYNKAIEISPRYAKAYLNRGVAYGRKGEYDEAISDYNKAIEISPKHAAAYTNRGLSYYFKKIMRQCME